MAEETQSNQQMIVIALIVIAVLLAAIVGVVIWQQAQAANSIPAPTANGNVVAPSASGTSTAASASGEVVTPPTGSTGAFDPKTATKVPKGMEPAEMLKAYGDAILGNKYTEAYKMLPLDKQQSYGDSAAYEAQVKGYGITKFNTGTPVTQGDTVTIVSEQVTPQMPITYTWSFKKVDGQWYVESRTMGGSVQ